MGGSCLRAMVARHFLWESELIALIQQNPGVTEHEARSQYRQVYSKDYSPPRRDRILEWQKEQTFPTCPNPEDPDACNVYKGLKFPPEVYEHISGYYEGKTESSQSHS
jgi:hypothetical protein